MIALAPLALFAALRPGLNVVPISALIVLLVPAVNGGTPIDSASYRILEVALGALIGLTVSALVVPSSAHRLTRQAAAAMLEQMAAAVLDLMAGVRQGLTREELNRVQDAIGVSLQELNVVGSEAEHERSARLSSEADTGPLRRTLLRLRHDLIILGRAAGMPSSDAMRARLRPLLDAVETEASAFMRASAVALRARQAPPLLAPFERALEAFDAEVEAMRGEGLTRILPSDAAERFFAVGFAFEQMHGNLRDLVRVVDEWGTGRARRREGDTVRVVPWIGALLMGAGAPALLVAFALGSAEVFPPAAAITLGHAVILGLPVALFYRRRQWRSPAYALAGGFLIGALPAGLYFWPLDPRPGTDVWTGTTQTLADGVPTWAGWGRVSPNAGRIRLSRRGGRACLLADLEGEWRAQGSVALGQPQHALGHVAQDELLADRRDAGDHDLAQEALDMELLGIAVATVGKDRALAGRRRRCVHRDTWRRSLPRRIPCRCRTATRP